MDFNPLHVSVNVFYVMDSLSSEMEGPQVHSGIVAASPEAAAH